MAEEAPGFRQPIKSIAVIKGKPAKFEAIVTGTPEPDVSWYLNGQEVAPTDKTQISREEGGRASLVLTSVTDDGGNIACTARNSAGTASSTAKLVVREPPDFVQRLKSQRVKEGSRVEMVVRFKGTPMPKIRWYRERAELQSTEDFRIVTEGDTSRLIIEEVYEDDSGKFSATATNVVGRVISAAHLMVTDTTPPATPTGRLGTPGKLTPGASPGLAPSPAGAAAPVTPITGAPVPKDATVVKPLAVKPADEAAPVAVKAGEKRPAEAKVGEVPAAKKVASKEEEQKPVPMEVDQAGGQAAGKAGIPRVAGDGQEEVRPAAEGTEKEAKAFPSPLGVKASDVDDTSVTLKWTPVTGATDYRVAVTPPDGKVVDPVGGPSVWERTVEGLRPGQDYVFTVAAIGPEGQSNPSKPVKISTAGASGNAKVISPQAGKKKQAGVKREGSGEDIFTSPSQLRRQGDLVTSPSQLRRQGTDDSGSLTSFHTATGEEVMSISSYATAEAGTQEGASEVSTIEEMSEGEEDELSGAPEFNRGLESCQVARGESVRFECEISGSPPPTIIWLKDGREIDEDNQHFAKYGDDGSFALVITNVTDADSGAYSCQATSKKGQATSTAELTVKPHSIGGEETRGEKIAPIFAAKLTDVNVKEGADARFDCVVAGTPGIEVTWFKDGVPVRNGGNRMLTFRGDGSCSLDVTSVTCDDAGMYDVQAANIAGTSRCSALLVVQQLEQKNSVHTHKPASQPVSLATIQEEVKVQDLKPPTEISTPYVSDSAVTVSWKPVAGATDYNIIVSPADGVVRGSDDGPTFPERRVEGLRSGTEYTFTVVATRKNGHAVAGVPLTQMTRELPTPGALRSESVTDTGMTLAWLPTPGATDYEVSISPPGGDVQPPSGAATEPQRVISGLEPAKEYEVTVTAKIGDKRSAQCEPFKVTTKPLGTPAGFNASKITDNSMFVSWTPVGGATDYEVKLDPPAGEAKLTEKGSTVPERQLTGLSGGIEYRISVGAKNQKGDVVWAEPFSVETKDLPTPSGTDVSGLTDNEMTVTWAPVLGATDYTLKVQPQVGEVEVPPEGPGEARRHLTGLLPGVDYTVVVEAKGDKRKRSAASAPIKVKTKALCSPSDVKTSSVTASTAMLEWEMVPGATDYKLHMEPSDGQVTKPKKGGHLPQREVKNLTPGREYVFKITAVSPAGNSAPSQEIKINTPGIAGPSDLKVPTVTDTEATLSWAPVPGAKDYKLRTQPKHGDVATPTGDATSAQRTISGLHPGTNYSVYVSAVTDEGVGVESKPAQIKTKALPCPCSLNASEATDAEFKVAWLPVEGAENYVVTIDPPGGQVSEVTGNPSTPSRIISGLDAGREYRVSVTATGKKGDSAPCEPFSVKTKVLCAPAGISATAITASSFKVTWTPVRGASEYDVRMNPDSGTVEVPDDGPSAPRRSITGLSAGIEYQITVVAKKESGAAQPSEPFMVKTRTLQSPKALNAPWVTDSDLTLTWEKVRGATDYAVRLQPPTGEVTETEKGPGAPKRRVTGLLPGTEYKISVEAVGSEGHSSPSHIKIATKPLRAPFDLAATSITDGTLLVSWPAVPGATDYRVTMDPPDGEVTVARNAIAESKREIKGLQPGKEYQITVLALSPVGSSAPSESFVVKTRALAAPSSISPATVTDNSAGLKWTAVPGATDYTLTVEPAGGEVWETQAGPGDPERVITGLQSGTEYEITVSATGPDGASAPSERIRIKTEALAAPSEVKQATVANEEIVLKWNPVAGATDYELTVEPPAGDIVALKNDRARPMRRLTGLTPGTEYKIVVVAKDAKGNTRKSDTFSATTLNIPKAEGLRAYDITDTTVYLEWAAISGSKDYTINLRPSAIASVSAPENDMTKPERLVQGLQPSTEYNISVSAITADGRGPPCNPVTIVTKALPMPEDFKLVNVTDETALIRWAPIEGAKDFHVAVEPEGPKVVPTEAGKSASERALRGLQPARDYWVTVTAKNEKGESNESQTFSFKTMALSTPSGFKTSHVTDTTCVLSWTPVAGSDDYTVKVQPQGGEIAVPSAGPSSSERHLKGLKGKTTYTVTIVATSSKGKSAESQSFTFTTTELPSPSGVEVSSVTASGLVMAWSSVPGATDYIITSEPDARVAPGEGGKSDAKRVVSGLEPGTEYTFTVVAVSTEGSSAACEPVKVKTRVLDTPAKIEAATATTNTAVITWTAVKGATDYKIVVEPPGAEVSVDKEGPAAPKRILKGLHPDTHYHVYVTAISDAGESTRSEALEIQTAALPSPARLSAPTVTDRNVIVSWAPTEGAEEYIVKVEPECEVVPTAGGPGAPERELRNLKPATEYTIRVAAKGPLGTSAYTEPLPIRTNALPAPSKVEVPFVSDKEVRVSWAAVPGATDYHVKTQPEASVQPGEGGPGAPERIVTGLKHNTEYSIRVVALTKKGSSGLTEPVKVTTKALETPSKIMPASTTADTAVITWSAVKGATDYKVIVEPSGPDVVVDKEGPAAPKRTLKGLHPDSEYTAYVTAVGAAGDSTRSEPFTLKTPGLPVPARLGTPTVTDRNVVVSWAPIEGAEEYIVKVEPECEVVPTAGGPSAPERELRNLKPATEYIVRVAAKFPQGTSAESEHLSIRTNALPAPAYVEVPFVSDKEVRVSWAAVPGATDYHVKTQPEASVQPGEGGPGAPVRIVTGMNPKTEYSIRVVALTKKGSSALSEPVKVTTKALPRPNESRVKSVTDNSAIIAWTGIQGAADYQISVEPKCEVKQTKKATAPERELRGLLSGTEYTVTITAVGKAGTSAVSEPLIVRTKALLPPTDVRASSVTDSSLLLAWKHVEGATSYIISAEPDKARVQLVDDNKGKASPERLLTQLWPNTEYAFTIIAVSNEESSMECEPFKVKTLALSKPSRVTAGKVGDTSALLVWAPAEAATNYVLTVNPPAEVIPTDKGPSGAERVLKGLKTNTEYTVSVTAKNPDGTSAPSDEFVFKTRALPSPEQPSQGAVTDTTATVAWAVVPGASDYVVKVDPEGQVMETADGAGAPVRQIQGLKPGTEYKVVVAGKGERGDGAECEPIVIKTNPLPSPAGIKTSSVEDNKLTLGWTAVPGATDYKVVSSPEDVQVVTRKGGRADSERAITGLRPGTEYSFSVVAVCPDGNSAQTEPVKVTTKALPTPGGVKAGTVGDTTATVVWSNVPGASDYTVQVEPAGEAVLTKEGPAAPVREIRGLQAGQEYKVAVIGKGPSGESAPCEPISIKTNTLGTPSGLKPSTVDDTSVTLAWTSVPGATDYVISGVPKGSKVSPGKDGPAGAERVITGLKAGTDYSLSVTAVGSKGESGVGQPLLVTTKALPTPGDVAVSSSDDSATISWAPVPGAKDYEIVTDPPAQVSPTDKGPSAAERVVKGLKPGTDYEVKIAATNDKGVSNQCRPVKFSTKACQRPTGVKSPSVTDNQATLTWSPVPGATDYRVLVEPAEGSVKLPTGGPHEAERTLVGLTAGAEYTVSVIGMTERGSGEASEPVKITTRALPPPLGVKASAVKTTSVTLSWSPVTGAQDYRVEVVPKGGRVMQPIGGPATWERKIVGLEPHRDYEFTVVAVQDKEESLPSKTLKVTTVPADKVEPTVQKKEEVKVVKEEAKPVTADEEVVPPAAPAQLKPTEPATKPAEAAAPTEEEKKEGKPEAMTPTVEKEPEDKLPPAASKAEVKPTAEPAAPVPDKKEEVLPKPEAVTVAEEEMVVEVTPDKATVPKPTEVEQKGEEKLPPTAPKAAVKPSAEKPTVGEKLEERPTTLEAVEELMGAVEVPGPGAVPKGKKEQPREGIPEGESAKPEAVVAKPKEAAKALPPPADVRVNHVSESGMSLGWSPVPGAARYEVAVQTEGIELLTGKTTNVEYQIDGLKPSKKYHYSVTAIGADGTRGAPSKTFHQITKALSTPGGIKPSSLTETGATIAWKPVSGATNYSVSVTPAHGKVIESSGGATGAERRLTDLQPNTEYTVSIAAEGVKGTSATSTPIVLKTKDDEERKRREAEELRQKQHEEEQERKQQELLKQQKEEDQKQQALLEKQRKEEEQRKQQDLLDKQRREKEEKELLEKQRREAEEEQRRQQNLLEKQRQEEEDNKRKELAEKERLAEEERKQQELLEKQRKEEDNKQKELAEKRQAEEQSKQQELLDKQRQDEEKARKEKELLEKQRKLEEEKKQKELQEKQRKEEDQKKQLEKQRKEEEDRKPKALLEKKRQEEEERKQKELLEKQKKEEEEKKRKELEKKKLEDEKKQKEQEKQKEEERKKKELLDKKKKEEELKQKELLEKKKKEEEDQKKKQLLEKKKKDEEAAAAAPEEKVKKVPAWLKRRQEEEQRKKEEDEKAKARPGEKKVPAWMKKRQEEEEKRKKEEEEKAKAPPAEKKVPAWKQKQQEEEKKKKEAEEKAKAPAEKKVPAWKQKQQEEEKKKKEAEEKAKAPAEKKVPTWRQKQQEEAEKKKKEAEEKAKVPLAKKVPPEEKKPSVPGKPAAPPAEKKAPSAEKKLLLVEQEEKKREEEEQEAEAEKLVVEPPLEEVEEEEEPEEFSTGISAFAEARQAAKEQQSIEVRSAPVVTIDASAYAAMAVAHHPTSVRTSLVQDRTLMLNWDPVVGAEDYDVTFEPCGDAEVFLTDYGPVAPMRKIRGLKPCKTYKITVAAKKANKERTKESEVIKVTTKALPTPSEFRAIRCLDNKVLFGFDAVYGATSYIVGTDSKEGVSRVTRMDYDRVEVEITDLLPAKEYQVTVTAQGPKGVSAPSKYFTIGTKVITEPEDLVAKADSENDMTVTWSHVKGATDYEFLITPEGKVREAGSTTRKVSGLKPGVEYRISVAAKKGELVGSSAITRSYTKALARPDGMRCVSASDTSVIVAWNRVQGATGYDVETRPSGGTAITPKLPGAPEREIAGLRPATEYEIIITGRSSRGDGLASKPLKIKTKAFGAVSSIRVTDCTDTKALIRWSPVNGATSYDVKLDPSEGRIRQTNGSQSPEREVTGLVPNKEYSVTIIPKSASGEGSANKPFSFTTMALSTPTSIKVSDITEEGLSLTWDEVPGAYDYSVWMDPPGATIIAGSGGDRAPERHISRLKSNKEYTISIVAESPRGNSCRSDPIEVTTEALHGPTGLKTTNITQTGMRLTFNPVANARDYEVILRPRLGTVFPPGRGNDPTQSERIIEDLKPNTEYDISVIAITHKGVKSEVSKSIKRRTYAFPPPSGVTATSTTGTTVTLQWPAVPGADNYTVDTSPRGGETHRTDKGANAPVRLVKGLQPGTVYEFSVTAKGKGGQSPPGETFKHRTKDLVSPKGFEASNVTESSIVLSWTPVKGANKYTVTTTSFEKTTDTSTEEATTEIKGLKESTEYTFVVTAEGHLGKSAPSAPFSYTTRAKPALKTPVGVKASLVNHSSMTITWAPIAGATDYAIEVKPEGANVAVTSKGKQAPERQLTNLKEGTEYRVVVLAVSSHGMSAASEPLIQQTALALSAPSGLRVTSVKDTSLTVVWGSVKGATSYDVSVDPAHGKVVVGPKGLTQPERELQGLRPGTDYTIRVVSKGLRGTKSADSAPITQKTKVLAVPQRIKVKSQSDMEIQWTPVEGAANYKITLEPPTGVADTTDITKQNELQVKITAVDEAGRHVGSETFVHKTSAEEKKVVQKKVVKKVEKKDEVVVEKKQTKVVQKKKVVKTEEKVEEKKVVKKVEPKKVEPKKPEPKKPEPQKKVEAKKVEPKKPEPKAEPPQKKPEVKKVEGKKTETKMVTESAQAKAEGKPAEAPKKPAAPTKPAEEAAAGPKKFTLKKKKVPPPPKEEAAPFGFQLKKTKKQEKEVTEGGLEGVKLKKKLDVPEGSGSEHERSPRGSPRRGMSPVPDQQRGAAQGKGPTAQGAGAPPALGFKKKKATPGPKPAAPPEEPKKLSFKKKKKPKEEEDIDGADAWGVSLKKAKKVDRGGDEFKLEGVRLRHVTFPPLSDEPDVVPEPPPGFKEGAPKFQLPDNMKETIELMGGQPCDFTIPIDGTFKPEITIMKDNKPIELDERVKIYTVGNLCKVKIHGAERMDRGKYKIDVKTPKGTDTTNFTVNVKDTPSQPKGPVIFKSVMSDNMEVSWQLPDDDGGAPLQGFELEICQAGKNDWKKIANIKDRKHKVTGLKADTRYQYRVSAINEHGKSVVLKSGKVMTKHPEAEAAWDVQLKKVKKNPPDPPQNPRVTKTAKKPITQAQLVWEKPLSDHGSRVKGYVVERKKEGSSEWMRLAEAKDCKKEEFLATGFSEGFEYWIRIRAVNAGGESEPAPLTDPEILKIGEKTPPPAPKPVMPPGPVQNLQAEAKGDGHVTINWKPPKDRSNVTGYVIQKLGENDEDWVEIGHVGNEKELFNVHGLDSRQNYNFRVIAQSMAGAGEPAITETVSLKQFLKPSASTDVSATVEETEKGHETNVRLNWTPPTDGSIITGFRIEKKPKRSTDWSTITTVGPDETTYLVEDMTPDEEFDFRIVAESPAGDGKPGGTSVLMPPAKPPEVPPELGFSEEDIEKLKQDLPGPLRIVKGLTDLEVPIRTTALYYCVLSKINIMVRWMCGYTDILPGKKYQTKIVGRLHILWVSDCRYDDEGIYKVEIPTKEASTAKLKIMENWAKPGRRHNLKPFFETPLVNYWTDIGMEAQMTVKYGGYPTPKIRWNRGLEMIRAGPKYEFISADDEVQTLIIKDVKESDAGEYTVTITNEAGEKTSTGSLIVGGAGAPAGFENQFPLGRPIRTHFTRQELMDLAAGGGEGGPRQDDISKALERLETEYNVVKGAKRRMMTTPLSWYRQMRVDTREGEEAERFGYKVIGQLNVNLLDIIYKEPDIRL